MRTACGKRSGKGVYTFNVVKEILAQDKTNEYILYTNQICADFAAFGGAHIKIIHAHKLFWHFAVIKDLTARGVDVFFAPTSYIIPAFLPKKIASVITVHDLIAFLHPALHQAKATILEKLFFKMALSRARHVFTPSRNTKHDLVKLFKCPSGKITVTPLGVSSDFFTESQNLKTIKEKYNLPDEFVLAVSGLEPRKNVGALISAVEKISADFPKLKLVIVGGLGWKSADLQEKISNKKNTITHIENCPPAELPAFYRLAKVFVYPSLYEGFGLPPLEAMASGCPVICSNNSSLPEVCGDAAIMIDPNNTNELANSIKKILTDNELRQELAKKGRERARGFTWQETAKETLLEIN